MRAWLLIAGLGAAGFIVGFAVVGPVITDQIKDERQETPKTKGQGLLEHYQPRAYLVDLEDGTRCAVSASGGIHCDWNVKGGLTKL